MQEKLISGMQAAFPGESQASLARRAGLSVQRFNNMELRRAGLRSRREAEKQVLRGRVKVVVVDLADWHAKHFGTRAG